MATKPNPFAKKFAPKSAANAADKAADKLERKGGLKPMVARGKKK